MFPSGLYPKYKYNEKLIQKQKQRRIDCHHLCMRLYLRERRSNVLEELIKPKQIIGKTTLEMPDVRLLRLELSFQKRNGDYYCSQCGKKLTPGEYDVYNSLFKEACKKHFDVWKLRNMFSTYREDNLKELRSNMPRGSQIYELKMSRLKAAEISLRNDEAKLYDELIVKFQNQR